MDFMTCALASLSSFVAPFVAAHRHVLHVRHVMALHARHIHAGHILLTRGRGRLRLSPGDDVNEQDRSENQKLVPHGIVLRSRLI
jgi:hypothetical protein